MLFFCGTIGCFRQPFPIPDFDDYRELPSRQRKALESCFVSRSTIPRSLRARHRLRVEHSLEKQEFLQSVVYEFPSRLRLDTFATAFHKLVGLLIISNGEFSSYNAEQNEYVSGLSTVEDLTMITHVPLDENEYVTWLLGMLPLSRAVRSSIAVNAGTYQGKQVYVVKMSLHDERNAVAVFEQMDGQEREPCSTIGFLIYFEVERLAPDGKMDLLRSYFDRSEQGDMCQPRAPATIQFTLQAVDITGTLTCENIEWEPDLTLTRERLFHISSTVPRQ